MNVLKSNRTLAERMLHYEEIVEDRLVERHGLVLSWIDAETMKPFAPGYFTPDMAVMRHPGANYRDFGAYIAYENAGMCSGAYLCALVCKYRVTGDKSALDRARRTFAALAHLYDVSQEIEPGFLCKFHEGRITREMSTDQCLYAMVGMDQFLAYATAGEAVKIREMIGGITSMWMRKDYRHPYRERNFPMPWPPNRFPVFCWMAWQRTGEPRFRDEFERLCSLPEVRKEPPFVTVTPSTAREFLATLPQEQQVLGKEDRAAGIFFWRTTPEHTASCETSLGPLLEYDAPHRDLWIHQLREAYEGGRILLGTDGLERGRCYYQIATGKLTEVETPFDGGVDGKPHPYWRIRGYVADVKSGHSPTMFARAALTVDLYHADLGAQALSRRILEAIDIPQMRWKLDYRNQLTPDLKWLEHAFDGDALVNWLWAYWLARGRTQIDPNA